MTESTAIEIVKDAIRCFRIKDLDTLSPSEGDKRVIRMWVSKAKGYDIPDDSAWEVLASVRAEGHKYEKAFSLLWSRLAECHANHNGTPGNAVTRTDADREEPFDPLAGKPWPVVKRELENLEAEMTSRRQPHLAARVRRQIKMLETQQRAV